jgi:CheY-like chemotaxis protein
VAQACESFQPLYEKKGVSLHYNPNSTPLNFYFDKNIVHHILFNLLSNAHKFTPAGGDVAVSLKKLATGMVQLEVADTGVGIAKEEQKHIFERFYQADSGAEQGSNGSGIGLNMVKEMVALHGGRVSVDSDLGEGSVFTVMLPLKSSAENKGKALGTHSQSKISEIPRKDASQLVSEPNRKDDSRFCVLVVEDNDEFRRFIADELSSEFHVLQACNGQEGIEIAEAEQVDLVLSDVMMPLMDGFELCHELKENEKTSHLSIILLTARAGQESELQGYQCGADYYITKPFDMEILKDRIRQVEIHRREYRQELLRQLENPDVDTLLTSDIESQFVNKVFGLLNKNISNSDYGLEELSSDLCMSYITTYRKIKSITGQPPGEFIRHFRLKRASQLLRSTTMSVTEVAMSVGFSTPSYFTRSFLKEYSMTPSDYRRKKQGASQQGSSDDFYLE